MPGDRVSYSSPLITNKQIQCYSPQSNAACEDVPELVGSDIAGCMAEHTMASKTTQALG